MSGVTSSDLECAAFASHAKRVELTTLLRAYETFLIERGRDDMAGVYLEAVKHPDWCPIQPQDCWTEMPGVVWNPLQRTLLDVLPGERIAPRLLTLNSIAIPRRLADRTVEAVQPDATTPLPRLLSPSSQPAAGIELFHAGGREAEIDEVFRRILSGGAPLDQVEIVCTSDAHASLVWEKSLRHEWPVTLGPGIAAAQTRPGRALLGLCDWVETDFAASHFRRLLQSGDMGVERDDEGFTAAEAARILGRADTGWGRATYALALGRLRRVYETRAADLDESDDDRAEAAAKADLTGRVLAWIEGLVQAVPEPDARGRVPLQAVVDAALAYVERTTARKSALDHRAGSALLDHVRELRALGTFDCALEEALRFIRERVQTLAVAAERPRPSHLFVSTLAHACYSGRPHLFIVGLEEGRVFPTAAEDPVLLDDEREALSPALQRSLDRIDEAVYGALSRLATWSAAGGASATFSYSCRDTREFRETYASWLMLQAYRLQQGDPAATYQQMKAALGEPRSAVPAERERAASAGEWWLRGVVGAGISGAAALGKMFPGVIRGLEAAAARSSDFLSEYDGHVPDAGAVLDPSASGRSLSVTELEDAAKCPFKFFLKRGLGLRPLDTRERDRDVWLDPLTRGAELHDLYAAVMRRCRDENRRLDRKKDGAWLRACAEERLGVLRQEMPPANAEVFARESSDFLADIDLFVEAESENGASTPVGFEVSFGRPLEGDHEPLARAESVTLKLAKNLSLTIAGRIDRVDQIGAGTFEVIDYKTGGFWPQDWGGVFNGGRRLQHALYGLAAAELLRARHKDPKVVAGVYYFPSRRGRRQRVRIETRSTAAIAALLGDLRDVVASGTFVHAPRKQDCRFCDYSAACDQSLEGRAAGKLSDHRLHPYGRLLAHA
jgi:ATP-dependent helicase/nuclease subunit B